MRIALVFAVALAAACAKKQPPPQAPASTPALEPSKADAPAPTDEEKAGEGAQGDPCDGGESK